MTTDTGAASGPGGAPLTRGVGDVLAGRYRLESLVGVGGMSSVFRAVDTSLGRTVAVKLFRPELAGADDLRRQQAEITLLASVHHPALVTLFDAVADDDGRAFLVLEFVDGHDLRTTIDRGPLEPATTAAVGAELADALALVHERGIVHRDVKPGNVLIPEASTARVPRAKLADFGIARLVDDARLTTTGSIIGTATYLSPEQAAGKPVGPSSDVYSLGLVLLECLTGKRAFEGSGIESLLARLNRDPVIPSTLGADWVRLLAALTAREPAERLTAPEAAVRLRELAHARAGSGAIDRTLLLPVADEATAAMAPGAAPINAPPSPQPQPQLVAAADTTASTAVTAVLNGTHPTGDETSRDESADRAPTTRRRRIMIAVLGLVLAALVVAVIAFVATRPPDIPQPTYPAVEGPLGENLDQLQRSVDR